MPEDRTPAESGPTGPAATPPAGKARVVLPKPPPRGGAAVTHGPAGGPPRKDGHHSQIPPGKPGRLPGRNG